MDTGDRVLCHACGQIEIPPDTDPEPSPSPSPSHPHPDPPESFPGQRSPTPSSSNPFADHNPWAHTDDIDDGHGWSNVVGYQYTHRTFQSPGGNIHFSYHAHSLPPRRGQAATRGAVDDPTDPIQPAFHGFNSFFQSLTELNRQRAARAQGPGSPGSPGRPQPRRSFFDEIYGPDNGPHSSRGPFDDGAGGLFPRDADRPQPMGSPLRSLGDILELFHTNLNNLQAGQLGETDRPGRPNVRVVTGGTPIRALLEVLMDISRNGDAVYSQEELDRVISELVEQNGNRTAAPPAAQDVIRALPKKRADAEMLGGEGTECSICMDAVKVGDEVTVLPCTHWFHPQCIELWLNQHNSCPHCRRGVDPTAADANATNTMPSGTEGTDAQARHSPSSSSNNRPPTASAEEEGSGSRPRTTSRSESTSSNSGGWTGWVRSRLGGGGS
ncbi:putative RING finger domain protein [Aspergillus nidulans FGSC A4]|uniref:RING-type E3 ubiquitin transferase n=1 Tax=Emericella nidulans (strain FGSC A4 / ATCC 38163 / CBS 112.46 / NRRL 194 / M139) TaxID=227321 RepID=C8V1R9_EMENI|nr:hypothetical protein [Aspergillus nidulans FGSC A4]CBF69910.1 TPA: RING finger domain protein, putative (AFU_orthologue; AFUA_2G13310) [Aspergillus nidulans FGSC A4]